MYSSFYYAHYLHRRHASIRESKREIPEKSAILYLLLSLVLDLLLNLLRRLSARRKANMQDTYRNCEPTQCCSVLQLVAVCCSVLQLVAVCCSVLQLVAV